MEFSTKRANELEFVSKYLSAGILENVEVTSARTDVTVNGNNFISILFTKDEKTAEYTVWEPKKWGTETDEDLQIKTDALVKRLLQILKIFYPEDLLNFGGSSFKEFSEWVVGLINDSDKNKLVRVKFVYNKDGYLTLPKFVNPPFIQAMTDKEITVIANPANDVFVRPVKADKEVKEDNPVGSGLPF